MPKPNKKTKRRPFKRINVTHNKRKHALTIHLTDAEYKQLLTAVAQSAEPLQALGVFFRNVFLNAINPDVVILSPARVVDEALPEVAPCGCTIKGGSIVFPMCAEHNALVALQGTGEKLADMKPGYRVNDPSRIQPERIIIKADEEQQ